MRSGLFLTTLIYGAFIFLCCLQPAIMGETEPREKGIWCKRQAKHRLTNEHEKLIVASLKRITGFEQLEFSSDGALSVGELNPEAKSSLTARNIFQQVLKSGAEIMIEDHTNSPFVNFGQLDAGTHYEDWANKKKLLIWRVRIDFDDFRKMEAAPEIQATFDPGIAVLHELLHSLGHKDPTTFGEIGECEEVINQVRTELGMPLRDRYHGTPVIYVNNQAVIVRMRFRERLIAKVTKVAAPPRELQRWKTHYLFFVMTMTDETSSALVGLRK
jgi:hypothetical protein